MNNIQRNLFNINRKISIHTTTQSIQVNFGIEDAVVMFL